MNKSITSYLVAFGFGMLFSGFLIVNVFSNSKPAIIVNLPSGTNSIAQFSYTNSITLTNDRAVVWWTVYHETLLKIGLARTSQEIADDAVVKIFGK